MDWSLFLDYAAKALGSLAATFVITLGSVLFAKLKAKIQDTKMYNYAKIAVKAAEQMYPNQGKKMGPEKFAYAVNVMMEKFPSITDNKYLKSLIESAVFELSNAVDKKVEEIKETTELKPKNDDSILSSF